MFVNKMAGPDNDTVTFSGSFLALNRVPAIFFFVYSVRKIY